MLSTFLSSTNWWPLGFPMRDFQAALSLFLPFLVLSYIIRVNLTISSYFFYLFSNLCWRSPTTTFPVVTKVDDLKKDNLYLAIVILAALLFIVMIILAVVLILLRKNQQEIGIWNLFAFSFKFNLTFSQLYYQGNLGAGLITISFSND